MPIKAKTTIKTRKLAKPTRWQKIFTPQIIIAVVLCAFCTIMAVVCFLNPGTKETSVTSPVENMTPLDAITPKDCVVQKFTSDDNYTKFGLYYANFSNYIQEGNLHISIENPQKEKTDFTYNIGGLFDNSFLYIDYPLEKDETYIVTIRISDAEGITFFTTTASNYSATMTINKQAEDASIIMAFVTEIKDSFSAWYFVMAVALDLCYIVLKVDRSVYDKKNR